MTSSGKVTPRHVLITLDAVGGVWQYALDLARGLTAHGDRVTLALFGPDPSPAQRAEAAGIAGAMLVGTGQPLDWLCDRPATVRAAGTALAALARRVGADLVHLNSPTLAAGSSFDKPVVAASHGCVATWWGAAHPGQEIAPDLAWHRALTAEGLAAANRLIAPTHAYARTVARTYGLSSVPAGVHNGRTPPPSSSTPPTGEPAARALTLGRLWDRVKRADLLDRVAARLSVPFDAGGAVTGPHGETVALHHLHLLGTLGADAVARRLAERPVFVSAAIFEPFGLAVLEAAQAGCALVLADTDTARELWNDAAIFVAGDDEAAYVEAIEALICQPDRREALGQAARTRSAAYTPKAMADATRAVHDAALAARPAPSQEAA